jgi:transposase
MARPSIYQQEYCEQVIEYGKQGKSVAWMAAELGVCKQTLHNWTEQYPEFLDAFTRAKLESQRWWEDAGQNNMLMAQGAGTFNASVWSRSMAARFPEDWREKQETTLKGGVTITATPIDERL